jgi:hypothetical protein
MGSRSRSLVVCLALAVMALLPATAAAHGVRLKPIGHPLWKPADLNVFSAEIGTAESGYVEFGETQQRILPPPDHLPNPALGIGPGAPHAGPYTHEIRRGVRRVARRRGTHFTVADFSAGNGVWLAYMVVPRDRHRAPKGSSPDFARGPIIPNAIFPIHVTGSSERFGDPFSVLTDFSVPPLDASIDPRFDVDGHSHFPIFITDNIDFGPPGTDPAGRYEWTLEMLDQTGSGWTIEVSFVVRDR